MTVATYSCDTGFYLNSSDTRVCLSNGSWSSGDPQCSGEHVAAQLGSSLHMIASFLFLGNSYRLWKSASIGIWNS